MIFLTMLLIPTFVALGFLIFGGTKITLAEFAAQIFVQFLVMGMCALFVSKGNTSDVEVISGRVSKKEKVWTSCSHSYTCNCRTSCSGSGKSRSCSTVCSTCYEHFNDWNWTVSINTGHSVNIDRIDRRGSYEPPRFTAVKIGEPASVTQSYTNYVKGSPDSLFRHQGLVDKYLKNLPEYPGNIYDYYRIDRFVTVGFKVPDAVEWNKAISNLDADIGPAKKANLVIVATRNMPRDYFHALEQHWIGSKKNDITLVMDTDAQGNLNWVEVMAWSNDKMIEVTLRDAVYSIGKLDRDQIIAVADANIRKYYVRKSMKDYEYLAAIITPTRGQWIFSMILGLVLSVGLGLFFYHNEVFESRYSNYRRRY